MLLSQSNFFSVRVEPFAGFLTCTRARSHTDLDAVSIRLSDVIEQVIISARLDGKAIHDDLHNRGAGEVKRVACLASLEENVWILCGTSEHRMVGAQRAFPVPANALAVDHGTKIIIRE